MSETGWNQIEDELRPYLNMMGQAADSIVNQDISNYPIFILHQQQVPFGLPLVEREKLGGKWSVHASTLEEFATKQLIQSERIEDFRKVYKSPKKQLCLFVIQEDQANFIFIRRKRKT